MSCLRLWKFSSSERLFMMKLKSLQRQTTTTLFRGEKTSFLRFLILKIHLIRTFRRLCKLRYTWEKVWSATTIKFFQSWCFGRTTSVQLMTLPSLIFKSFSTLTISKLLFRAETPIGFFKLFFFQWTVSSKSILSIHTSCLVFWETWVALERQFTLSFHCLDLTFPLNCFERTKFSTSLKLKKCPFGTHCLNQ